MLLDISRVLMASPMWALLGRYQTHLNASLLPALRLGEELRFKRSQLTRRTPRSITSGWFCLGHLMGRAFLRTQRLLYLVHRRQSVGHPSKTLEIHHSMSPLSMLRGLAHSVGLFHPAPPLPMGDKCQGLRITCLTVVGLGLRATPGRRVLPMTMLM